MSIQKIDYEGAKLTVSAEWCFSPATAIFSHLSSEGYIVFKDCKGNYAYLADDDESYVVLEDLSEEEQKSFQE